MEICTIPFAAKGIKVEKLVAKNKRTEFSNLKERMAACSVTLSCLIDNQIWICDVE